MGVAGCGKTSVGEALITQYGWAFIDGDALHPQRNIDKMAAGEPLTDEDRLPWLMQIGETMRDHAEPVAIGCSALKRGYRDIIRMTAGGDVCFIFLNGSRELIETRMAARTGHFMPLSLLDSQFDALEPPTHDELFVDIDISGDLDSIVSDIRKKLEAHKT
ncbi:gluconokinase [Hoeflea prorocentri]|uniref:Gluconokinase n=2 Tax=Hoeflea prorocentri TaxID=1922333 RepID=A0A9X3ZGA7_9HYPH|nr:gluconokinase [Hoeflea prorocentri]MCY6379723.1 gluconokinase [Hoeflea prorocentri]MDA5397523.1 gluconokinase [Hoeflea prorocentri]